MQNLEEKVKNTIKKYNLIEEGDKLILAVSGGPDSMCMLNVLLNLIKNCQNAPSPMTIQRKNCQNAPSPMTIKRKNCQNAPSPTTIYVAHINHMLRDEADEDEQYVKEFCKKNQIEFYSKRIDVKKLANTNKIGLEEAGRKARYEFFDEILLKTNSNKIAIAHNKNDKVETVLMNVLRGSGTQGLKGIEPKRKNIIRPLIECERSEIEAYCEENKLNPRIDKTNLEDIYSRNKIRNIVIPYIQKEFNPNIIKTIDRLSNITSKEDEYIEKQTEKAYQEILIEEKLNYKQNYKQNHNQNDTQSDKIRERPDEIILDLKKFNSQEIVIKSRLIRYTIKRLFGSTKNLEKIHIEDIIKLCSNNIGNKYLTPNKNVKFFIKNNKIYITNQS